MKKSIIIVTQILFLTSIISTGAFAIKNIGDNFVEKHEIIESINQEETIDVNEPAELASITLQMKENVQKNDFYTLLKNKDLYPDEIATTIEKFLRLSAFYQFSDQEISQVYKWVDDGCDFAKLLEVYEFAQDTEHPRDWQYAKQIYDKAIEIKVYGKNWIEIAFNALTENRGGILVNGELQEYIDSGLSIEEIQIANIMSRKGKNTIQQILNEKLSGKSWTNIAESIYTTDIVNAEVLKDITEAEDIYNCIVLADITNMELKDVVSDKKAAYQKVAYKNRAAKNAMKELNIPQNSSEEIIKFAKEKLGKVSEKDIQQLLLEGHSIRELEKYNLKAQKSGKTLSEYLK